MGSLNAKPKIGVMGSSIAPSGEQADRLKFLANQLGRAIAQSGCVLVTGATTGLPDLTSRAARSAGAITIGISPAESREEHSLLYGLPDDGAEVIIYTGFGLKGRNVINIRACDIIVVVGGGIGTLNEFTIAFDEGKVIGILEGTGGVADRAKEIAEMSAREVSSVLICDSDPENLINGCLAELNRRQRSPD